MPTWLLGFSQKKHVGHDFTWWFHILSWVIQKSCTHRNCGKLLGHVLKVWKPRHGLWWRSAGEKSAISSLCWSVLRHVEIDLRGKKWRGDPSRDYPTWPIFTDSSMMFCSRTSWFQEEFAEPNTIGIVAILRTLSCNRIPILFGQFSRGISMIFDVQ